MATSTGEGAAPTSSKLVRFIVISGLLGAIQILLAATQIGFIPTPWGIRATILHIPTIVAAVLAGPISGLAVGLIFGIFSMIYAASPVFLDPRVAIFPRLLIGPVAWLAYWAVARFHVPTGAALAGVLGTVTNTVLVLGLGIWLGYFPPELAATVATGNAPLEILAAAIVTTAIVIAVTGAGRRRKSTV